MGNFGTCCYENKPYSKDTVLILEEYYDDLFRPKIYKVYRLNSFHNYGYRRQILLEQEFIEMQNKNITKKISVIDFFRTNSKILSKIEKALLKFTYLNMDIYLKSFQDPNNLFFNVAMFVLSNTKNNLDKKQEILLDIINSSFFECKKNEQKIDLDKFKKLIKNLIYISLTIFLNIILLQVFETKDNIIKLLEETTNFKLADKYNKYSIAEYKTYSYDQLWQFETDQNFLQLMRELSTGAIESEDSNTQIKIIVDLRRMRKFHSDLFLVTFNNIISYFIDNMIYNNDSNVTYNALVLITEIFSQYGQEEVGEWITDLLQAVLQQSSSSNEEIRKQCSLALYNTGNNMYYEDTLTTLIKSLIEQDDIE